MAPPRILACLAVAALHAGGASAEPLERLQGGLAATEVRVDGLGPFRFVIDTAATQTTLLPSYWTASGARPATVRTQSIQGVGGASEIEIVRIGRLAVADRTFDGLEAYRLGASPLDRLGAQGVLGADVLSRHVLVLDAGARDWRLDQTIAAEDARLPGEAFTLDAASTVRLTVTIDGVRLPAIVDTGATGTIINWAAARALGIEPEDPTLGGGGTAQGVGAAATTLVKRQVERFTLAGVERRGSTIRIGDLPIFGALGFTGGPAVIVGMDQFADRRLVIDYPNRRLHVGRPPAPAGVSPSASSGVSR